MPTPMTHAFVGASLCVTLPKRLQCPSAAVGCAFLAALPDLDVLGFFLGVPYSNTFGHRGLTHGLPFAALVAAGVVLLALGLRWSTHGEAVRLFLALTVIIGSHGILDMATDGGLGVGLLIPFWSDRLFLPFRPIEVSPIDPSRFLTDGAPVLVSELVWVWIPSIAAVIVVRLWQDRRERRPPACEARRMVGRSP